MHQNMSLGSNGVDRVCSLRKVPMRLWGTNFRTSSAHFPSSFANQPNSPNCTKIVWNAQKYELYVHWGGSGAFIAKNSDATSWHELLHQFGLFCTEFLQANQTVQNASKLVWNAPELEFRVQWGGLGVFVAKSSNATSWHELSHQFCTFSIKFCEPTKQSQLH